MQFKKLFTATALSFMGMCMTHAAHAQDILKKTLRDTVLQERHLLITGSFDGMKALQTLFPGKYYNLSEGNHFISWTCPSCKVIPYADVNEDGGQSFPYEDGVATRLLNVLDFTDSAGGQYKMLAFSHSAYDPDGGRTGRFVGGLLGLAKFTKTPAGWLLRGFSPAIGAYGAFSSCPSPTLLKIGADQYAFLVTHNNGPGGGPFDESYFLIAGTNGAYREVLAVTQTTRVQPEDGCSLWKSSITVTGDKKYFRDIVVTTKGTYHFCQDDFIPGDIMERMKGVKSCTFSLTRRYVYGAKGYVQQPVTDFAMTGVKR